MSEEQCWIVTLGTVIEDETAPYHEVCDELQSGIEAILRRQFNNLDVIDDSRALTLQSLGNMF